MLRSRRDVMLVFFAVLVATMIALYVSATWGPVPDCKIVDGREINDHHCVPYCPPDPKECN